MSGKKPAVKRKVKTLHFYVIIFFMGMLFTVALWDAYFNGTRSAGSILVLIMGTLFSTAAALFSWSLETRRDTLEKQVSERTRELHDKNKALAEKNQEIENFVHIISHDLKAPIVSIQGFASILKNELGKSLQGAQADYLSRILANVKQMHTMILDLLEFSRVGRVEDEKEKVSSKALFDEILAAFRPQIDQRGIKVSIEGQFPDLWGAKKRLNQVFSNILGNAVKYMGNGASPQIDIGCEAVNADGFCTFWVKDNGIGIKKEYQDKIFQIFQRVPNSLKAEGSGIGLSIVKKIVEQNGGAVWIESEEGKGSRFFVSWPLAARGGVPEKALEERAA